MCRTKPSFLLLFSLLFSNHAFGAACCGGGPAAPSLILGDEKALLTASYSYTKITDDVGTDSFWRRRETLEATELLKLEGAHIISDRWQAGLSLPLQRRSRAESSSAGLGDLAGTLAYEILPEWEYNPWKPRGVAFLQLVAPTGRSISEANALYQLDARGRGFWALGAGLALTKIVGALDLSLQLEGHRSFSKPYRNAVSSGTLKPGVGGNLGLGAGLNLRSFRFGALLGWTYEDPIEVSGTASSKGAPQRFATATLSLSYLFPHEVAATLSYSDQSLFGSPTNTTLGRGMAVLLQKRWLR